MKGNKGTLIIIITDPLAIASKFNDFFINIGPSLAATISSPLIDHNDTYSSFFISPTSLDEIIDTISKLKTSNSGGINGIIMSGSLRHLLTYLRLLCPTSLISPFPQAVSLTN